MNGIKAIRTQLGLSQKAFAEALGQTQGNVSHYETMGQTVRPEVARKVIQLAKEHGFLCTFEDVYSQAPRLKRSARRSQIAEEQGA